MNIVSILLSIFGIAGMLGAASVWFSRSRGEETIRLLEINIASYKDAIKIKDRKISYLEGQLDIKDQIIERLINESKSKT